MLPQNIKYIDFHTHMHDEAFLSDIDNVIDNIYNKNIAFVTIGTDKNRSLEAKNLSEKYNQKYNDNFIFYTIGIHPLDYKNEVFSEENYKDLLSPNCIAIGECGLDYFAHGSAADNYISLSTEDKDIQKELFRSQIRFAKKYNKKLMIHGRPNIKHEVYNPDGMDAYRDILNILKEEEFALGGNMHFFVGDINIAKECIALGFTFSFGGVLTLTQDFDEVVKFMPLEYIHAETDSPYVAPKGSNGKRLGVRSKADGRFRNDSSNVVRVIEKIGELKGLPFDKVSEALINNFLNFTK